MTKPSTSTKVATNGAEALAGSKPTRCKMKGSIEPMQDPKVTIPTKAIQIVKPISKECSP